jgi:hypothetical protein
MEPASRLVYSDVSVQGSNGLLNFTEFVLKYRSAMIAFAMSKAVPP